MAHCCREAVQINIIICKKYKEFQSRFNNENMLTLRYNIHTVP